MADEEDEEAGGSAEEGEEGSEDSGGKGGKKKLLIIVAVLLLLVIGGVAAAYFTGLADPLIHSIMGPPEQASEEPSGPVSFEGGVFYELPELLVNLNTTGRTQQFLKMRISIEISSEEQIPQVEQVMPRIVDGFQVYLRELRVEDLKGSAGMYRLREELLKRVNASASPVEVRDVLFREMLVQ